MYATHCMLDKEMRLTEPTSIIAHTHTIAVQNEHRGGHTVASVQVEEFVREKCRAGDSINGARYRSTCLVEQTALVGTGDVAGGG